MSYEKEYHNKNMCDKCGEIIPFLFKDMNDESHPDLGEGYRQYYVCKKCFKEIH